MIYLENVLSEKYVEENKTVLNRNMISKDYLLTEIFIEKWADYLSWGRISKHQKLSEEFIWKNRHRVDWDKIIHYQQISQKFITEKIFMNYREYMEYVFEWQTVDELLLTSYFISGNSNPNFINSVIRKQKISESFIEMFSDIIPRYCLAQYQKLSLSFIKKWKHKLNLGQVLKYQDITIDDFDNDLRKELNEQIVSDLI